jgi:anti-sigma regulatory factor (Ser/Thr protein kinase)
VSQSPDGGSREAAVLVSEASGVSAARRVAAELSRHAGLDEIASGRVAIVVTEAATNLVKHGAGGEILLQALEVESVPGIEMLSLDRGSGISDVGAALRDGYSTAGSAGTGLGAISRQADVCEVYSVPGQGTAVLAQVWATPTRRLAADGLRVGAASAPRDGEVVSGDGWLVVQRDGCLLTLVVDGLGHGPLAAEARHQAVRIVREGRDRGPAEIVAAVHAGLRATRGAAVAVASIDLEHGRLRFSGLGNIAAAVLADRHVRHLVSHNGTAGHNARKIDEYTYPWPSAAMLVQHTDGLASHWTLESYPGLTARHPSLVAGVLYRDFKRGGDDVAVLVVSGAAR